MPFFAGGMVKMPQLEPLNLVVNSIQAISLSISGVYLTIRAVKLRSTALLLLSGAMLTFISTIIVNVFVPVENVLARSVAAASYALLIVLFTKNAFYRNKKSPFKLVFGITLLLRIVHFTEMNVLGHVTPSGVPIPVGQLGSYYFHLVILTSQLAISFGWLSIAAFKEYYAVRTENVDLWVRHRYWIIGFSNGLFALMSLAYFLIPTDGLAFASPDALAANLVIPPLVMAYGVLGLLSWLMPPWFKRLLNGGRPLSGARDPQDSAFDIATGLIDRAITTPELMKVIDYLGVKLAAMIRKPPDAAKGLLLMAIERELGELALYSTRFNSLLDVTKNSLHSILKDMGFTNADVIVATLSEEIIKNQSVFLMISV